MPEQQSQQPNRAERVARRAFIKKAALGAACAVPVIESLTKSDLLVKSALAATAPVWRIMASVYPASEGTGTVLPVSQMVVNGGSASVTVTPAGGAYWLAYRLDGAAIWTFVPGFQQIAGGTVPINNVTANHAFEAWFLSV
jgi:hypothetical protein